MPEKTYLPGPLGDVLKQIDKRIEALNKRRGDSMRELNNDIDQVLGRVTKLERRISALEKSPAKAKAKRTPVKVAPQSKTPTKDTTKPTPRSR